MIVLLVREWLGLPSADARRLASIRSRLFVGGEEYEAPLTTRTEYRLSQIDETLDRLADEGVFTGGTERWR